MADIRRPRRFAVLDPCWGRADSERAYVARAVAGVLACHGRVDVLVRGAHAPVTADGAFDVRDLDATRQSASSAEASSAPGQPPYDGVLVVAPGHADDFRLGASLGDLRVLDLGREEPRSRPGPSEPGQHRAPVLTVAPGDVTAGHASDGIELDIPVTVQSAARSGPLNGIGCADYVLVLGAGAPPVGATDADTAAAPALPAGARWLIARFSRSFVLTLEHGVLTVWRRRSPLGSLRIGTRMDLWRLMAFARVTVDLRPGPLLARESVESMLLGTPIVVPDEGIAAYHARHGAGARYRDVAGLLDSVERQTEVGSEAGRAAQAYAESRHGSPVRLIEQVRAGFSLPD